MLVNHSQNRVDSGASKFSFCHKLEWIFGHFGREVAGYVQSWKDLAYSGLGKHALEKMQKIE